MRIIKAKSLKVVVFYFEKWGNQKMASKKSNCRFSSSNYRISQGEYVWKDRKYYSGRMIKSHLK